MEPAHLFERMPYSFDGGGQGRTPLIIGAAGGVGSIAIQLVKLAGFRVITTASRPHSRDWCLALRADVAINHHQSLGPQLQTLGVLPDTLDAAINLANTDTYWNELGELLAPQGHAGLVVEPTGALRIGIHWEMMFARPRFRTADMTRQGEILAEIAHLVDDGTLRSPPHPDPASDQRHPSTSSTRATGSRQQHRQNLCLKDG